MAWDKLTWSRQGPKVRVALGRGKRNYRVERKVGTFTAFILTGSKVDHQEPCASFEAGREICQKHHEALQQIGRDIQNRMFDRGIHVRA